jgi:hypothetical protein
LGGASQDPHVGRADDPKDILEVIFTPPDYPNDRAVDEEYRDQVHTVDCAYGVATLIFDQFGWLKSIDVS